MRVLLTASSSDAPLTKSCLTKVRECASIDKFRVHEVVEDPENAELILFVESDQGIGPFGTRLRRHPLVRKYREKCFTYNSSDRPVAHLPGLYASVERSRYDAQRVRTSHYLASHLSLPPLENKPHTERSLLFSFIGDVRNAPVRSKLVALKHPRGISMDVSAEVPTAWNDTTTREAFLKRYGDTMTDSKFCLCPRGIGTSSIRLFEAMRTGCVPVVLSDGWVPPVGPDWERFCLVVPEHRVESLPELLEQHEATSASMGKVAREEWEAWFADDVSFHRLVEWCLQILAARSVPEALNPARLVTLTERCWPKNALRTARTLKAMAKQPLMRALRTRPQ